MNGIQKSVHALNIKLNAYVFKVWLEFIKGL
jgi:hypothetical protein